jgi:hydrogenase maturation protease
MAGDDGVGVAVARRVREFEQRADIEVIELTDPSALVPLLTDGASPVVLIDALVDGGEPGRVIHLAADRDAPGARLLSSHGVGVRDAVEIARSLEPEHVAERIEIVAVTIARPSRYCDALSPAVAAALDRAAALALELAGG